MFAALEGLRETSSAEAVFGEPVEVEDRLLVPVAAVARGFGMAFSAEIVDDAEDVEVSSDEGNGSAGGGSGSWPVAVLEISERETVVRPIIDETKTTLAAIALVAWVVFWVGATIRSVFGHS
jgi:uncharacterized spore protein YtfJ